MSAANFYNVARDRVNEAVQEDMKGNYAAAVTLYTSALEYLFEAKKHEKIVVNVTMYDQKIEEYMTRAQMLKDNLEAANKPQSDTGGGEAVAPKTAKQSKEDEDDATSSATTNKCALALAPQHNRKEEQDSVVSGFGPGAQIFMNHPDSVVMPKGLFQQLFANQQR